MAEDLLVLLDHLSWDAVHLVGHSLGGMVSQEAALLRPSGKPHATPPDPTPPPENKNCPILQLRGF